MKKIVILLAVLVSLILVSFVFLRSIRRTELSRVVNITPTPTISSTNTNLKMFKSSSLMKFTVELPNDYSIAEKLTYVEFSKGKDSIDLSRTDASGFNSLNEFLAYADDKNNLKNTTLVKNLNINGCPAIIRIELRGGVNSKIYYIGVDKWVYGIYTSSKLLYSDLDQIAQSFRYTP